MLVGRGNVHRVRRTRQSAGRDTRGREFIALVMAVLAVHFLEQGAAINGHVRPETLRLNRFGMFGEQKVRDDNDRALVFLREIKGFDGGIEAVCGVPGGDDDPWEITLRGTINLV